MWSDLKSEEPRLTCPGCGAVGNGLATVEDGRPSYFCLSCLTRSQTAPAAARRPNLFDRIIRITDRKG